MTSFKDRLDKKGPPGLERRFDAIIDMHRTGQIVSLREIVDNYNKHSAWDFFTFLKMQADLKDSDVTYELGFRLAVEYITEGQQ